MGDPFDSTERKSIPDAEKERALDFKTIWDFEVKFYVHFLKYFYFINKATLHQSTFCPCSPNQNRYTRNVAR